MLIEESKDRFEALILGRDLSVKALRAEALLELGFEFYQSERADDALPITEGDFGDALLFQWGSQDAVPGWQESCFYFDLTRQFISRVGEDDDAMFQLRYQLQYQPSAKLSSIGEGNRWCGSLQSLAEFRQFAFSHPALAAVRGLAPNKVEFVLTGL